VEVIRHTFETIRELGRFAAKLDRTKFVEVARGETEDKRFYLDLSPRVFLIWF